jgi:hypothetical protein
MHARCVSIRRPTFTTSIHILWKEGRVTQGDKGFERRRLRYIEKRYTASVQG